MTSVIEVQTHECVTQFQTCQEYSGIGLCTGVRLNIGKICAKQCLGTLNTKGLQLINELTSTIISLTGQTFRIFIG